MFLQESRFIILQECRQLRIPPTHIKFNAAHKNTVKTTKTKNELKKAYYNFQCKLSKT